MKDSALTVTDQFCGCGGSSQGVRNLSMKKEYIGLKVRLALNHWKLAIETHNTNFPDTVHDCADVSATNPQRYFSTDILITSPECTNHSLSKGVKRKSTYDLFDEVDESAVRSRATMWDVPRFTEYHKYNLIIVENVVDARKWVLFDDWLKTMHTLGYLHKMVYANSMFFHPTPQSRDRMYVVFWKKGNRSPDLEYKPKAYCRHCSKVVESIQTWKKPNMIWGRYKTQYTYNCPECKKEVSPYYYAAFNCIDWTNIGTRIGDRNKPLSENTLRRIRYGLDKYGQTPLQIINYSPGYARDLNIPVQTITSNDHIGLCTPFIINTQQTTGNDCRVKEVTDKLSTVTSSPNLGIVSPFVIMVEHGDHMNVRGIQDTLQTQTTRQSMGLIQPPFITELFKSANTRPVIDPIGTQMPVPHYGIVTNESWNSFISYWYGSSQASQIIEAARTIVSTDSHQLVTFNEPKVDDCYYRMLFPREIQRAMAFKDDYIVLGSQKDKVHQLGNAVTPPVMEWLVEQGIKTFL